VISFACRVRQLRVPVCEAVMCLRSKAARCICFRNFRVYVYLRLTDKIVPIVRYLVTVIRISAYAAQPTAAEKASRTTVFAKQECEGHTYVFFG
jgi:hypothetical protein